MRRNIFLDLDGVLADFDTAARKVFDGMNPREFEDQHGEPEFWRRLAAQDEFYTNLPLMPGAREFHDEVNEISLERTGNRVIILTGTPSSIVGAAEHKRAWVKKHMGHGRVITCASKDKSRYCQFDDILIDDWDKYRHLWEGSGGKFIHHKTPGQSLSELTEVLAWRL